MYLLFLNIKNTDISLYYLRFLGHTIDAYARRRVESAVVKTFLVKFPAGEDQTKNRSL